MFLALLVLVVFSSNQILAEKENVRSARAFRNIPPTVSGPNTYPSYNIPNIHGPGTYAFGYEIEDHFTGNLQFRDEEKLADGTVRGAYGVLLPDGIVVITKYIDDGMGYRTEIERHNLNDVLQNYNPMMLPTTEPMHYSIQLPGLSNNQVNVQSDQSSNNGIFGWFNGIGQNIQNAFRPPPVNQQSPPPSGPLYSIFRPITSLFNRNPENNNVVNNNNQGLFGFFQNIPFIGGGNAGNNPNYNNVEQFSAIQAETGAVPPVQGPDYYDYDIPIIRPLAVPSTNRPQQSAGNYVYSNLLRAPPMMPVLAYDETPMMLEVPANGLTQDGWFKKLMKRRRLQQQLKKEAHKEIKVMNKKIRKNTAATPGFSGQITN